MKNLDISLRAEKKPLVDSIIKALTELEENGHDEEVVHALSGLFVKDVKANTQDYFDMEIGLVEVQTTEGE